MRAALTRSSVVAVVLAALLATASQVGASATPRSLTPPPPPPTHRATGSAGVDPLLPRATGATSAPRVRGAASPWHALSNRAPFTPGAMLLLTDGTVMVQDQGPENNGSSDWWKLTPDATGSYVNGTWSQIASLAPTYAPLYFASAVLPDGRVIIEGGEYNSGSLVWTNKGAIYDPIADTWTPVPHPKGSQWSRIGDAPSTVLSNGTFMVGASGFSGTTAQALLNAATLTWESTGAGKADGNGEEGWSLLPNGTVLTVDSGDTAPNTEIYTPVTGMWTSAGSTPVPLAGGGELGPQLLRPNGTVLAAGATGSNAVYDTATGTWSAGPSFPVIGGQQYDSADGPGAVLPDGNVLLMASPGEYTPPSQFFEFDGANLNPVKNAPNSRNLASNFGYMMLLPTGQVLFNDRLGRMEVYNSSGAPDPSWRPRMTSVPTTLAAGGTYTVAGRQLNGLTQGSAYGDDYQSATNYPLVRITNSATHHAFYARTSGMTSMSVLPNIKSSATFAVPAGIETGPSTLVVVANGIASPPKAVTITG